MQLSGDLPPFAGHEFGKGRVRRDQLHFPGPLVQILDGEIVIDLGHDDIAMACLQGAIDDEDVPVADASFRHGSTAHAPEKGRQGMGGQQLQQFQPLHLKIIRRRGETRRYFPLQIRERYR